MSHTPHTEVVSWNLIRRQIAIAGIFLGVALIIAALFGHGSSPLSIEAKFTDASAHGMQIVPASCPSDPHYVGNCNSYCTLLSSAYGVSAGGSVTLTWSTAASTGLTDPAWGMPFTYVSGTITPAPGSVGQSGTAQVTPPAGQSTTYNYDGSLRDYGGANYTFHCDATINSCPANQGWNTTYNICQPFCAIDTPVSGPYQYGLAGGGCVCPVGTHYDGAPNTTGGKCVCDVGSTNPSCVTNQPPTGGLDGGLTCDATGWAQDPDVPSQAISVKFYLGPNNSGTPLATVNANAQRADAHTGHGFTFSIPSQYRDGIQHQIAAYAVDNTSGNPDIALTNSPQNFTCSLACVPNSNSSCQDTTHIIDGACPPVVTACQANKVCVQSGTTASCQCPAGTTWNSSTLMCEGTVSCQDRHFCSTNPNCTDEVTTTGSYSCHQFMQAASCVVPSTQCANGCLNGECIVAPTPTIAFTVTPLIVKRGTTVRVAWTSTHMSACTVTATNGDSWTAPLPNTSSGATDNVSCALQTDCASGYSCVFETGQTTGMCYPNKTTQGIIEQAIYTLHCTVAATGAIMTKTATVGILPVWCEPTEPNCSL